MLTRARDIAVTLTLVVVLLLVGGHATAENWIEEPSDEDVPYYLYYDADSIKKIGGLVRMKVRLEMVLEDLERLTVFDFNCEKGLFQEYLVADDGKITKVNDMRSVEESTEVEIFSRIACKHK